MTMSGLFFFLVVGLDAMTPHLRSVDTYMRTFARLAVFGVVAVAVWPRIETEEDLYGTRKFPNEYVEPIPGIYEIISKYTMPEDRIFTTGMPALYVQANRLSAIRESAIVDEALGYYDGDTDAQKLSGLRAELEKNRPKVVILDPAYGHRKGRTNGVLMYPFLTANGYKKLTEYVWLRPDIAPP
jgi:hypothetical protein